MAKTRERKRTIVASGVVHAPPDEVFSFLSALENHWLLADRFIEVLGIGPVPGRAAHGGTVRMRGPLGMRRTATTSVLEANPNSFMSGYAELTGGTCAEVSWTLAPNGDATNVRLAAHLAHTSLLDHILLAAGGRAWLCRRFASILERLADRVRERRAQDWTVSRISAAEPV